MNLYYKGVNRGLSFTKPGLYAVGLLLLIGLVGVATGINGLYVFLSAGMGGFVISGLISEKAMVHALIRGISPAVADAGCAFAVSVTMENNSRWFTIYELEMAIMLDKPRFYLIAVPLLAPLSVRCGVLPARQVSTVAATCQGLPRGVHQQVKVVQKTKFPFAILEKFKVATLPVRLVIGPAIDADFLANIRPRLLELFSAVELEQEFFAHRNYQARDGRRAIDWRKSAGKPVSDWVIKLYQAQDQDDAVLIKADWSVFAAAATAQDYEQSLSRLRTLLAGLEEVRKSVAVDFGGAGTLRGFEAVYAGLAAAPHFASRQLGLNLQEFQPAVPASVEGVVLVFDGHNMIWPNSGGQAC